MTQPIAEIIHREEFSAAHRLFSDELTDEENRRLYGPCYTLHGHNYAVEVTVRGAIDERTGMVMDLNKLMVIMREEIFAPCDHKFLNEDVEYLAGVIPTAENLAVAFWERIVQHADALGNGRLARVRVLESANNVADYFGPDEQ